MNRPTEKATLKGLPIRARVRLGLELKCHAADLKLSQASPGSANGNSICLDILFIENISSLELVAGLTGLRKGEFAGEHGKEAHPGAPKIHQKRVVALKPIVHHLRRQLGSGLGLGLGKVQGSGQGYLRGSVGKGATRGSL